MDQNNDLMTTAQEYSLLTHSLNSTSSQLELFSFSTHSSMNEQSNNAIYDSGTESSDAKHLSTSSEEAQLDDSVEDLREQLERLIGLVNTLQMEEEPYFGLLTSKDNMSRKLQLEDSKKNESLQAKECEIEKYSTLKCDISKLINLLKDSASKACNQEDYDKAIQLCDQAIDIEQSTGNDSLKLSKLYLQKGQTHFELKEHWKALSDLSFALFYRSGCISSLKLRAKIEFELGKYSWAEEDLEAILSLDFHDEETHEFLAVVHDQMQGDDYKYDADVTVYGNDAFGSDAYESSDYDE